MAYAIEDEKHFQMECPAYQAIRADFQEFYDDCRGDMGKHNIMYKNLNIWEKDR
jgi:hypothetical protein